MADHTSASKSPGLTPKASWPGRLLRICLLLILLLLLLVIGAALALPFALPWLLQQQGIDFDWQNPHWRYNGFSASSLQLSLPSADGQAQSLQLNDLHIDWAWQTFPIQQLQASRLQVQWPLPENTISASDNAPGNVPARETEASVPDALLRWLPRHVVLKDIDATLAGLGHLQGSLELQTGATGTLWQPHFIQTQLTLDDLQGAWLEAIPEEFQPTQLSAQITTHPDHQDTADGRQRLSLDIHSAGPMTIKLNGTLDLQQKPHWQGTLKNTQLLVQLDTLAHPSLSARQLQLRTTFDAQADTERFTLNFSQDSKLEANTIELKDIGSADKMTVHVAGLKLEGRKLDEHELEGQSTIPYAIEVSSPITAQIKNLNIEQLHKQNWDFKGNLSGQLPQLELTGDLIGQQGLSLNSSIRLLENAVQGNVSLNTIFFKAGNPLQKTLKAWPPLLTFNSGRLSSQIDFKLPLLEVNSDGPLKLTINGNASGISGIIDRSELKNLNLEFLSQLSGQTLKLAVSHLSIEQLDPGIPIGPIQVKGAHYQASLNNPLQGVADWQRVEAKLLNGKVWLDAQQFDLNRPPVLALQVQGLELQELLKVYPAEGLDGTGIIDGLIPIRIENNGLSIAAGQLKAREPGVLQFRSAKIQALGESNPAMRLVADALDNFHFSLLSSAVNYDQSGKLLLEVVLQGQNPKVEKGRRINLNVNLEEDIPALLASIQLSGQVSETIQKRVRERFEKR